MKLHMRRWLLGVVMLFLFAGVYMPPQAQAKVVIVVGHHHRRHHHRPYRR
jgi:regulator of protease activity HflC (stomatin/prohibitin superfamily)